MFTKWKERLANKREFKMHDRVCERHFEPDNIIEFWENNINGEIHRTPRDKPKLRENALPSLHLPSWNEFSPSTASAQKKKIEILSHKIISKRRLALESSTPKVRKILVLSPSKNDKIPEKVNEEILDDDFQFSLIEDESEDQKEKKVEAFEILYDEAFDVTLPSTLWGIHRDPERKFLIFSSFDGSSMKFDKYLHVNCELKCKILRDKKIRDEKIEIENCTTEFVSEWLNKIENEES
jgi:hypothetical protein